MFPYPIDPLLVLSVPVGPAAASVMSVPVGPAAASVMSVPVGPAAASVTSVPVGPAAASVMSAASRGLDPLGLVSASASTAGPLGRTIADTVLAVLVGVGTLGTTFGYAPLIARRSGGWSLVRLLLVVSACASLLTGLQFQSGYSPEHRKRVAFMHLVRHDAKGEPAEAKYVSTDQWQQHGVDGEAALPCPASPSVLALAPFSLCLCVLGGGGGCALGHGLPLAARSIDASCSPTADILRRGPEPVVSPAHRAGGHLPEPAGDAGLGRCAGQGR